MYSFKKIRFLDFFINFTFFRKFNLNIFFKKEFYTVIQSNTSIYKTFKVTSD